MVQYQNDTVEKKIKYKVEVDDLEAQVKVQQIAALQTINMQSMLNQGGMQITPQGEFISPAQALNIGAVSTITGTLQAFQQASSIVKGVVSPLVTPGKYQDYLFPGGRYALESTWGRELFHGYLGIGYGGEERWFWQTARPEWMTEGEYRYQLKRSFGRRLRNTGIDVATTAASWLAWSIPGVDLITGMALSPVIEKAGEAWKEYLNYQDEIQDFIRDSGLVGKRVLGINAVSEEGAKTLASKFVAEDFSVAELMGLKKRDVTLKDVFEKMSYYGMLNEETSVGEIKDKVSKIREFIVKYAELYHTTREQVLQITAELNRLGVKTPEAIGRELELIRQTMAVTGMGPTQTIQMMQQGGAMSAQLGYSPLLGQQLMQQNVMFAEQLYEQGRLAPWERPQQAAQRFTANMLSYSVNGLGRALLMAAINPETGQIDRERLQQINLNNLGEVVANRFAQGGTEWWAKINYWMRNKNMTDEDLRTLLKAQYNLMSQAGGSREDIINIMAPAMGMHPETLRDYLDDERWRRIQENNKIAAWNQQIKREGGHLAFQIYDVPIDQFNEEQVRVIDRIVGKKPVDVEFLNFLQAYASGVEPKRHVNWPELKDIVEKYTNIKGALTPEKERQALKNIYTEAKGFLEQKGITNAQEQNAILAEALRKYQTQRRKTVVTPSGARTEFEDMISEKDVDRLIKLESSEGPQGFSFYKYLSDIDKTYIDSEKVSTEERRKYEELFEEVQKNMDKKDILKFAALIEKAELGRDLTYDEKQMFDQLMKKYPHIFEQISRSALGFNWHRLLGEDDYNALIDEDKARPLLSLLARAYKLPEIGRTAKVLDIIKGRLESSKEFLDSLTGKGRRMIDVIAKDIASKEKPLEEDIASWVQKGLMKEGVLKSGDLKELLSGIYLAINTETDTPLSRKPPDQSTEGIVRELNNMSNTLRDMTNVLKNASHQ